MNNLTLVLTPPQAAHYIRSYSYDILSGNTADKFIIDSVKDFVSKISDSQICIDILYVLLTEYAEEVEKLSEQEKNSSLYYNLSDFVQFHHIFSTLNEHYGDDYNLPKILTTLSDMAHVDKNTTVIKWLEFYNV